MKAIDCHGSAKDERSHDGKTASVAATLCGWEIASFIVSTGDTQASVFSKILVHSSRVRDRKAALLKLLPARERADPALR